jgi:protease-4
MSARRIIAIVAVVAFLCLIVGLFATLAIISMRGFEFDFIERRNKVGIVEIEGIILDSSDILKEINRFKKDGRTKAIVLRINSPGGQVAPAQEIFNELRKIVKEKKLRIVASLGSVAASGAYYIACGAEKIIASPGTITGSIGSLTQLTDITGLLRMLNVKTDTIKSGKFKDMGSPFRPATEEEKELMKRIVDDIYQQFLSDVAESRNIPVESLRPVADGRIITGKMAKQYNLIDEFGNLQDAIRIAAEMSGIKEEPKVVYPKKEPFGWLRSLFFEMMMAILQRGE